MTWHAQLSLNYRAAAGKTLLDFSHDGPLRILQSLYPEGDAICQNVLVHPPGGVAGGDDLDIKVHLQQGTRALITTPGATRFYKTSGDAAIQRTTIKMEDGARLEWLPLENIAYNGCLAENKLQLQLAPTAELIGWDITALGLPAADLPFERGAFTQHLELQSPSSIHSPWLERGRIAADDTRLLQSPIGLAGHTCLATLFFIAGRAINTPAKELFLSKSREISQSHALNATCGITSPHAQVIVLRVLAHHTEQAMDLCKQVRGAWRELAWGLPSVPPRIWAM
ncbi:MAG: urease accessory protein UreD [Burkholderiales bacterium]|nr:MAG: urease accessory protein UreD [Burkholderiales bacterium]